MRRLVSVVAAAVLFVGVPSSALAARHPADIYASACRTDSQVVFTVTWTQTVHSWGFAVYAGPAESDGQWEHYLPATQRPAGRPSSVTIGVPSSWFVEHAFVWAGVTDWTRWDHGGALMSYWTGSGWIDLSTLSTCPSA